MTNAPLSLAAVLVLAGLSIAQNPAPQDPAPAPAPGAPQKPAEPKPWRLDDALGTPEWLRISGETRFRWEGIDGQFRPTTRLDEADHFAVSRTSLLAEVDVDPYGAALELLDARHYGAGTGSFMNDTIVNALDVLQAYGALHLGDKDGDTRHHLFAGRQTIDLGSRRLVARNAFRNTINAFDGLRWRAEFDAGSSLEAFWAMPVSRQPGNSELGDQLDNELELDESELDLQLFGAFFTTAVAEHTTFDVYAFGLNESGRRTAHRELYTPGARIVHEAQPGTIGYEAEAAVQFGDSRASANATRDLDHFAWFWHVSLGYQFDAPWQPYVRVAWDYASGDEDPNDGDNGRFDTLFGARRFEYGPTGIYGAVARANLNSPELRVGVTPAKGVRAIVAYRPVWLAEERDAWTAAGVVDPTGAAGDEVGHQFEASIRWDVAPRSVTVEIGGAVLLAGDFQENAPNGVGRDTYYGYSQFVWRF